MGTFGTGKTLLFPKKISYWEVGQIRCITFKTTADQIDRFKISIANHSRLNRKMITFGETLTLMAQCTDGGSFPIHFGLDNKISNRFEIYQLLSTSRMARHHLLYRLNEMRKIKFATIYLHHPLLEEPIAVAPHLDEPMLHAYLCNWVNEHLFPLTALQEVPPPVITSPAPSPTTPPSPPQPTMDEAQQPLTFTVQYFTGGPITTFKIPTTQPVRNQTELFDFLINEWYARVCIFRATFGMRFEHKVTAFVSHPFLSSAIPIKINITNEGLKQELIRQRAILPSR